MVWWCGVRGFRLFHSENGAFLHASCNIAKNEDRVCAEEDSLRLGEGKRQFDLPPHIPYCKVGVLPIQTQQ